MSHDPDQQPVWLGGTALVVGSLLGLTLGAYVAASVFPDWPTMPEASLGGRLRLAVAFVCLFVPPLAGCIAFAALALSFPLKVRRGWTAGEWARYALRGSTR